jgi:hypothetical protein
MFITVLPKPDVNYVCAPKLNHTITFLGKFNSYFKSSSCIVQGERRLEALGGGVGGVKQGSYSWQSWI